MPKLIHWPKNFPYSPRIIGISQTKRKDFGLFRENSPEIGVFPLWGLFLHPIHKKLDV